MTGNVRRTRRKGDAGKITRGDIRLLLSAALFLGAVVLKTSGAPWAGEVRTQVAGVLRGGIPAEQVLQVAGQTLEKGGLTSVFADWSADFDEEGAGEKVQGESGQEATTGDQSAVEVYAETAFPEDALENRIASNFPKEADTTAYVLGFSPQNPVEGVKTSAFGMRTHPISGKESFHYGLDIGAAEGTPIAAFADGTVRETGSSSYGNYIIVDHAEGMSTLYAHCSKINAKKGQVVAAGEEIAQVGATGNATGNHLHLEVWRAGKALDPANYVNY